MAKIIQFDRSLKVRPLYYTPEALRGRLLQFKSHTVSVESAGVTESDPTHLDLTGLLTMSSTTKP